MKFNFVTALRRATRLTRAIKPGSTTKTLQRAIRAAMVKSVADSFAALAPAKTPRKPTVKAKQSPAAGASPRKDRRLGVVVSQLRAAKASMPGAFPGAGASSLSKPPAIRKTARYLDRTHAGAAGSRDFKLYLPADTPGGPKGLILMLHGCTQDPIDFATGTNMNAIAQKHGLAVAYPAQTRSDNASSCWNWFSPSNQARGKGEPAIIASLTRGLMEEFGLGRGDVFVAGLSAGGAMAVILADTYPDVFSAAGIHSGLARGTASSLLSAISAMRSGGTPAPAATTRGRAGQGVRRIIFHGDADGTVHPANAQQIVVAAVGKREPAQVSPLSAAGRDYVRSDYRAKDGSIDVELWQIKGTGHAWSGGKSGGSFTDAKGPDASSEMVRFFLTGRA